MIVLPLNSTHRDKRFPTGVEPKDTRLVYNSYPICYRVSKLKNYLIPTCLMSVAGVPVPYDEKLFQRMRVCSDSWICEISVKDPLHLFWRPKFYNCHWINIKIILSAYIRYLIDPLSVDSEIDGTGIQHAKISTMGWNLKQPSKIRNFLSFHIIFF